MTDRDALIARLRKLAAMANPEEEWQAEIGWTCAEAADALAALPPPADAPHDMAECAACGRCVRWDLQHDRFWGFEATCPEAKPETPEGPR